MQNPTKGLGEVVRGVDYPWDVLHDDVAGILPILDGKVLDVNMTGAFRWDAGVDHIDGRFVVFVDWGGAILGESQIRQDGSEVFGMFGCSNGSQELSFGGACGSDRLSFAAAGHCTAG